MKQVVTTEKKPIKMWFDESDKGAMSAMDQAKNLANLPFTFKHVALMPDCHMGYGMPIGGVLATKNVIIPNAVGVDIGCGVAAVKTNLKVPKKKQLIEIVDLIKKVIPVGFKKHKFDEYSAKYSTAFKRMPYSYDVSLIWENKTVQENFLNAAKSLGTLGGGNHFIELQKDKNDYLWIMIHSGSRNLGLQVAKYYNNLAKEKNKEWFSSVDPKHDLASLPFHSEYGQNYYKEMQYCVEYAKQNRKVMMEKCIDVLMEYFQNYTRFQTECFYDVAHNYAALENHYGKNVIVHRKGATKAYKVQIGIIPGSQGTSSFIVKGKGNKESFMSCSHGAGRQMGRKKAQESLDFEHEKNTLDEQNIVHSIRGVKDLDEASGAYKNINEVMENQSDLVEIVEELKPVAVIKG